MILVLVRYLRRRPTATLIRQNRFNDNQDAWPNKKALPEEIQSSADRKEMKKFNDALKTVYGPKSSGATPLLSADEKHLSNR